MSTAPMTTSLPPTRAAPPVRRRAAALVFTLVAVLVAATLAMSFMAGQSTAIGVAGNARDQGQARYVAESGLAFAISYVRNDADWRSNRAQGSWVTDQSYGAGTFTIVAEDGADADGDGVIAQPSEGDGSLSDDSSDLVTLTVTSAVGNATHRVSAVITPHGESDLVGHWKLDESSGTNASDSSGNGHDGTVTNGSGTPAWQAAQVDGGLQLDGVREYIRVEDHNDFDLSDEGTLAMWAYMRAFTRFGGLIHKGDAKNFSDEVYSLQLWSDPKLYFGLCGSPRDRTLRAVTPLQVNKWYHIAASWDTGGMYIYLDGVLDSTTSNTVSVDDSVGGLNIGAQLPVDYSGSLKNLPFNGVLDDVRIYKRALTGAEIAALAAGAGSSNPPTAQRLALTTKVDYGGSNAIIDAYDSTQGPYGPDNQTSEAVASVNAIGTDRITLYTNATLAGDALIGPGGDVDAGIKTWSGSQITGQRGTLEETVAMPSLSAPTGAPFDGANEGDLDAWGSMVVTITSDRHFNNAGLWGSSTLRIEGEVTILCDGSFEIGDSVAVEIGEDSSLDLFVKGGCSIGGRINANTQNPYVCAIYMLGTSRPFEMYDNAEVHAHVANPNGRLEVWNETQFYGSYMGTELEGNGGVHIDLGDGGGEEPEGFTYTVQWKEVR